MLSGKLRLCTLGKVRHLKFVRMNTHSPAHLDLLKVLFCNLAQTLRKLNIVPRHRPAIKLINFHTTLTIFKNEFLPLPSLVLECEVRVSLDVYGS